MTIRRSEETGNFMAQCDICFDVVDFDDIEDCEFDDAKAAIDKDGWKTKRQGDKWINICPDCK